MKTKPKTDFASIKLARPFVQWLRVEAAKQGVPMYAYLESLLTPSFGTPPWKKKGGR